jgi:predicted Zn-ribbon and HTH transcriptional regulator
MVFFDRLLSEARIMPPLLARKQFRCGACGYMFWRDHGVPALICPRCGSFRVTEDRRLRR